MKTLLLSFAAIFSLNSVLAQFSQNFDGSITELTNNCWTFEGVYQTTTAPDVITGTGSMYTNPPTNSSTTRDIKTPALNITSTNFTVSFNYKVSSKISGNATRTIEVGLLNTAGIFTSLYIITMDKNSPTTVLNFNQTFTLAAAGVRKLMLKLGGSTGDGNSRLIVDDLYASANPLYGSGTCNSAPVAVDDSFNGVVGAVIIGNILANDSDPNGEPLTPTIITTPLNGLVVVNPNGTFIFTPAFGFMGSQTSFTYLVSDNGLDPLNSNVATVTMNFSNGSLPVKLASFTATLGSNSAVNLKWTTTSEINTSHFVVERSIDGISYSDASLVFANGSADAKTDYSFVDNISAISSSVIYYRLASVDIDGKSQYSDTRMIRIGKKAANTISITAFPNPVINEVRVSIPSEWQNKKVAYEVLNAFGQVTQKLETVSSSQTETINTSSLSRGFYIVKVTCEGQSAQQKIVKH